jgi:hypothetical protein
LDILTDESGAPSVLTEALRLIRALEREAAADGGARLEGIAASEVTEAASPALASLTARLGARLTLRGEEGRARGDIEVVRR